MTLNDIQNYMGTWAKYSYLQGIDFCKEIKNNQDEERMKRIIAFLGLSEKTMDGTSIEGLYRNDNAEKYSNAPLYSDEFQRWLEQGYITPVTYIYEIVKDLDNQESLSDESVCGLVARGLRSFPSFFRELELSAQLEAHIKGCSVKRDVEEDVKNHTDILLGYNNNEYRIWSYQSSPKGIQNTMNKFIGKRGQLPKGIHILCPFNKDDSNEMYGWKFYPEKSYEKICRFITDSKEDGDKYSDVINNGVKEYLSGIHKVRVE